MKSERQIRQRLGRLRTVIRKHVKGGTAHLMGLILAQQVEHTLLWVLGTDCSHCGKEKRK